MTKSCQPPLTSKSAELSREEQARALCLRLLTARARTRSELAGIQLTKRGHPDYVSTHVLDRLAEVGLVDDADFAEQWVRSRHVNAGKGKRALAAELRTKGVDNNVITAALADIDTGAERDRANSSSATSCVANASGATTIPRSCAGSSGCWPGGATTSRWRSTWSP